jgi:hypothetical protein
MKLYTEKQLEAIRWLDWEKQKLDGMMAAANETIAVEMYGKFKDAVHDKFLSMGVDVPEVEAKELLLKYIKRDERGCHDAW